MKSPYPEIIKHSAVYGLAHIIIRAASFLLLPLYTRYLRPADYGCMAILDLTANLLALMVGAGIAAAANRYHFEAREDAERDGVWWSAQVLAAVLPLTLIVPAWWYRDVLARLTLGPEVARGSTYLALILPTIWFGTVSEVGAAYMRARKWSGAFMTLVVSRLALNIALNVVFLVALGMGVKGILLGNLIVAGLNAAILLGTLAWDRRRFAFQAPMALKFARFGLPLTASALLVVLLNQADRYLLRLYLPLDRVGIYSLAYVIAEGVSSLLLAPFIQIWYVALYEIAKQPGAKEVYARVFQYYFYVLMLSMLGLSLAARPILGLMAARDFAAAADLVPLIGLGYVFFSLNKHFEVPALLAKRTISLLPAAIAAAVLNVVANLALIPAMGVTGAAWATLLSFAAYSAIGLWLYRRIDRYDYPLRRCGAVLLGMSATYLGYRLLEGPAVGTAWRLAIAAAVWSAWAALLFGRAAGLLLARLGGDFGGPIADRLRRMIGPRLAAEVPEAGAG